MSTYIHWFRRDLRLHDNPALDEALRKSGGQVIPLFILDDAILRAPDTAAARVAFLLDSLRELDRSLRERGSRLILRRGPPAEVLAGLAEQAGAAAVCFNRDYTPAAIARDAEVRAALEARGTAVHTFKEAMLAEPGELATKAGTPYLVYAPYRRRWQALVVEQPLAELPAPPPFVPPPPALESLPIPSPADLGFQPVAELPPGGERAGLARLEQFVRPGNPLGIAGYPSGRERPALAATSGLSAYLRFGCVAPRACLRAAQRLLEDCRAQLTEHPAPQSAIDNLQSAIDVWLGELAWRDFYYQILAEFPHAGGGAFKRQYDALAWDNHADWFDAWRAGRTGYPIVDAAMRQLSRESWMHNRARMIVASFLTKDLLIDWRWGEQHFMLHLVDGDLASNNGGWQWAAGTGTDPQPYFRIFHPVSQGTKFDPRGEYVRRYVPELAQVPNRYIHAPWTMPPDEQRRAGIRIGSDYPAPIVDHATQRARALAMYRQARIGEIPPNEGM
jgi:deoxyribodipyrimidine photo-lyase